MVGPSLAEELASLPDDLRGDILASLTPADFASLAAEWLFWARPKQKPPWEEPWWRWCLMMAGRGSGKSRTGAEFIRHLVEHDTHEVAIIGPTYSHVTHFMLGGRGKKNGSGLLDVFPKSQKPRHWKADKLVEFHTGAIGYVMTGEDEEIRGANLGGAWLDEPIKIRSIVELFDNLELTMRADETMPRGIITTTPQPGHAGAWLKELIARDDVHTVFGSTRENTANLAPTFLRTIERKFAGTRVGMQEIEGRILEDDEEGQMFRLGDIERARVAKAPRLVKGYVCVDPAAGDTARADDVGIVGIALGEDEELYVLADRSGKMSPAAYGNAAVAMHDELRKLVPELAILVENNKLGQHVAMAIRAALATRGKLQAAQVRIEEVHAVGDKSTRADPVSALCERGLLHVVGHLPDLEAEITGWRPGRKSPGRLDAMVHGAIKLAPDLREQPPPVEDPRIFGARSMFARGDGAGQRLAETADEAEDEDDMGGSPWAGLGGFR